MTDLTNALKVATKTDEEESLREKDFYWDQLIKYVSSVIVAQVLLTISISFLRDDSVACFHPSDTLPLLLSYTASSSQAVYELARGQSSYIDKFCESSAPSAEYFPLYIIIHGTLLIVPHFLWTAFSQGDIDSFFFISAKLTHLRSHDTGEYPSKNFDHVKELERQYKDNKAIMRSYLFKLLAQLIICISSILVSALVFSDFSVTFMCPRLLVENNEIPPNWPLNVTVPCVYASLRGLQVVQGLDYGLTSVAVILILTGFIVIFKNLSRVQLNEDVAKLTFESGLWRNFSDFPFDLRFKIFWTHIVKVKDFDFLLLLLIRANASYGEVINDIQV